MTNSAMSLDDTDRRLLALLQRDNRLTYDALAERAHISASAARRRVARLRETGVIAADISILAANTAGITVIVSVMMLEESQASYRGFRNRVLAAPEVSQCYTVTGEADFILVVNMPDLPAYERWIDAFILSDPHVRRCDSNVVYSRVKFETAVPL